MSYIGPNLSLAKLTILDTTSKHFFLANDFKKLSLKEIDDFANFCQRTPFIGKTCLDFHINRIEPKIQITFLMPQWNSFPYLSSLSRINYITTSVLCDMLANKLEIFDNLMTRINSKTQKYPSKLFITEKILDEIKAEQWLYINSSSLDVIREELLNLNSHYFSLFNRALDRSSVVHLV